MKPMHECAVIKDGKEMVGAMVAKTESCTDKDIVLKNWEVVSWKDFEGMVANGDVQFLELEGGNVVCRYDREETKAMNKYGVRRDFLERSSEFYFDVDVVFQQRHVEAANRCEGIACGVANVQKVLGMPVVQIYMYGNAGFQTKMVSELSELAGPLGKCHQHNMVDVGLLTLPLPAFEVMLRELSGKYRMMFDTSAIRFIAEKGVELPKVPLVMGKVSSDVVLDLADALDAATKQNEQALNLHKSFSDALLEESAIVDRETQDEPEM